MILFQRVSFAFTAGRMLLQDVSISFGRERTGIVGRNGAGKSTLLRLATGELTPNSGTVIREGRIQLVRPRPRNDPAQTVASVFGVEESLRGLDRISSGVGTEADLAMADWTLETRISQALAAMDVAHIEPFRLLNSLSGGQRTRVELAAMLLQSPDLILFDEPTNDLDTGGRAALGRFVAGWRKGAVVVSHDRELLRLMDRIIEVSTLGVEMFGGNWDQFARQKEESVLAAERALAIAERNARETEMKIQAAGERKAQKDSHGKRRRLKHDMPKTYFDAMRDRSGRTDGVRSVVAERARQQAADAKEEARRRVERLKPFAVQIAPSGLPATKRVLSFENVTAQHGDADPVFSDLSFSIIGPERVAVVGSNGTGKTTLLEIASGRRAPIAGHASRTERVRLVDQYMSFLEPDRSVLENFSLCNPEDDEEGCHTALARFRFRAEAALHCVSQLSDGERLRAGLACMLGGTCPPELLLLDEPTNHLDLESIAVLEAGLMGFDGALLVASHDQEFLNQIRIGRNIDMDLQRARRHAVRPADPTPVRS